MKDLATEGLLAEAMVEALDVGRAAAKTGRVASYIPELAKADPNLVGISIHSIDGPTMAVGDADSFFTMQSVSKVFFLAHAIREQGPSILERMS